MIFVPLLFLFAVEMILRIATTGGIYLFEKNPHYVGEDGVVRLAPNTDVWWYGNKYNVNAQGFRMTQDVGPKKKLRILGLGDSITLGMGVRDTDDVWPNKLQSLIRAEGGASVDVINAGVQGWNLLNRKEGGLISGQYVSFLQKEGAKLNPDIVIYCICLNDVPSHMDDAFIADNAGNKRRFQLFPESWREWFKRKALYRLLRDGYRETRFDELDFSKIPSPPRDDAFWLRVSEELKALNDAAKACGAKLYCIIYPYSYQILPANRDMNEVNRKWQDCLAANSIPYVDLTPLLDEKTVLQYYALGDYIHPNAKGHALIAQKAFDLVWQEVKSAGAAEDNINQKK